MAVTIWLTSQMAGIMAKNDLKHWTLNDKINHFGVIYANIWLPILNILADVMPIFA